MRCWIADDHARSGVLDAQVWTLFLGDPLELVDDVHLVLEAEADEEPWLVFDGDGQSSLFSVMKGTLELRGMVLQNGHAEDGGAIVAWERLTIERGALENNEAWGWGGAIAFTGASENDHLRIVQSTVSGNDAWWARGILLSGDQVRFVLDRSILAYHGGPDIASEATSLMHENHGYNLVGSVDDLPGFAHPTDLIGIDPGLSALAQHGGLFPSVAPSPTSPVVDHVPVAACLDLDGDPLLVDQRGFPRPAGAGCDIGAFEVQSGP